METSPTFVPVQDRGTLRLHIGVVPTNSTTPLAYRWGRSIKVVTSSKWSPFSMRILVGGQTFSVNKGSFDKHAKELSLPLRNASSVSPLKYDSIASQATTFPAEHDLLIDHLSVTHRRLATSQFREAIASGNEDLAITLINQGAYVESPFCIHHHNGESRVLLHAPRHRRFSYGMTPPRAGTHVFGHPFAIAVAQNLQKLARVLSSIPRHIHCKLDYYTVTSETDIQYVGTYQVDCVENWGQYTYQLNLMS